MLHTQPDSKLQAVMAVNVNITIFWDVSYIGTTIEKTEAWTNKDDTPPQTTYFQHLATFSTTHPTWTAIALSL